MGSSSGLASPFSLVTLRSRPSHPMIATASYSTCFNTSNKKRSHRNRLPTSAGNVAAYRSLDTRSHRVVRVVCLGGEQRRTEEELDSNSRFVRTLLIDNYDSYTYNIYQELSVVNGLPPVVVHNDERTMDYIRYCLYEEKAFDNIVISPGPGSPKCPEDVGICLEILLECGDIPILGVCLGHQALGFVHGAQVVHAPEPVHGRLSEIEHTGCNLFSDIPSGSESGFKVVRYHSLVLDADTLPKELIPIAWTTSTQTLSFLENQEFDMIPRICGNGNYPPSPDNYFANNLENKRLRSPYKLRSLNSTKVLMGIMHSTRPHYGVQFHPESVATSYGSQIFKNFKKMTIDYMLRSSPLHEINAHNGDAGISCAHQISKKLHKSKLLVNNVTAGHYSDIFTKTAVAQEVTGVKHLKLQWKKFDSLANQIGGSGNIFFELFGGQNAEDTFWLDSSSTDKKRARFSFMGGKGGALWKQITFWLSDHRRIAEGGGGYISIQDAHGLVQTTFLSDGFLEFLNRELQSFRYDKEDYEGLPFDFCGGFVGFIGYGLKVECGASSNSHKSTTPDACFFFADHLLVIDHSNNDVYLLYIHDTHHSINAKSVAHESWLDETEKRLLEIKAVTSDKLNGHKSHAVFSTPAPDKTKFVVEKSRDQYMRDVEQCLNFIRDGESYELCLTTQMKMEVKDIDALGLYLKIRGQNPAPYAAWLHFHKENLRICCSSPERFLRLDGNGTLEAKPIKGTIARGRTPEEDEHLRLQLQHSEKDRAENLMIVDLLRNDLGRVCEPGTVYVPHLIEVESYATVHTLVSTIRGKKKTDLSPIDCIRAAFPGGSMTGAPKLRSIKLLDSLECCSRGVYSGCIGFLSYNQTFDLNIVIRTVVINDGEASIGAGGAIVALSNPEDEYEEMMLKARAPAKAIEEFSRELNSSGIII